MTNAELNKMTVAELKSMVKEQCSKLGKELPVGLWKMPKDSIIKEIELNLQMLSEENTEEVKEDKGEEKPKKKVHRDNHKLTTPINVVNPKGEIEFTGLYKDVCKYATSKSICSVGWVNICLKDNVPVTMGKRKSQTLEEYKKNPKVTELYNGNFYEFKFVEA